MININTDNIEAVQTYVSDKKIDGYNVLQVIKDSSVIEVDEPTYARVKDIEFQNGTIEVKVYSKLLADAPDYARGFIGVTFRINDDNSEFEGIYIRPTNGRCEIQSRRNASTQYFSYPDYKFDRFRKETPGMYESYVDIGLDEWIDLKIVVDGEKAKLYVNGVTQPTLIVNDLKHGKDTSGAIGLWVDIGTEGYFRDLKITNK